MNKTNFYHAIYALVFQAIIGFLTGNWWAGAAAGAFFFIGREHTQAEYRWIKEFGGGKRANLPEFGGLDPRVWRGEYDAIFDWLVPCVVVVVVNLIIYRFWL